jgi:hypothetical protein
LHCPKISLSLSITQAHRFIIKKISGVRFDSIA